MAERREVEIERLGAQGDGIVDDADGLIHVARALPGERVVAEIEGHRGRAVAVLRASAERIAAPCMHFGTCGGCTSQHMSEASYRRWKRDLVRIAFSHRGLDPAIEDIVAIPAATRRRATLAAERAQSGMMLGFHEEGSHALVDLACCAVVVPAIERSLPALRSIAEALARDREALRLVVTATPDGLDVAIAQDKPRTPDASARGRVAQVASSAGILRVTVDGHIVMQSAVPRLTIGGATLALPPGAFIQATAEAEAAISAVLCDAVGKARRVADLFCGVGTFSLGLARRARVAAFDSEPAAIAALTMAAKATAGLKPIAARVRDLMHEPLSRTELVDIDAVVLDPPRAGARAQSEMLARAAVPVVCMVSCNPATLARDCRILVDAGYRIARLVPVDQFVWSPHVEAVAVLERARKR